MDFSRYFIPAEDRTAFLKVMAYLAMADGVVSPEEQQFLDTIAHGWGLSHDEAAEVQTVLEQGADLDSLLSAFQNVRTGYLLIQELVTLALIDGEYSASERAAVKQIAASFEMTARRLNDLEQWAKDGLAWRERGIALVEPERT